MNKYTDITDYQTVVTTANSGSLPPVVSLVEVANQILQVKANRRFGNPYKAPCIEKCKLYQDGNFTFVVVKTIEGKEYTGMAKFNPADVRRVIQTNKHGYTKVAYKSKYDDFAGTFKAIHRAVEKMLPETF